MRLCGHDWGSSVSLDVWNRYVLAVIGLAAVVLYVAVVLWGIGELTSRVSKQIPPKEAPQGCGRYSEIAELTGGRVDSEREPTARRLKLAWAFYNPTSSIESVTKLTLNRWFAIGQAFHFGVAGFSQFATTAQAQQSFTWQQIQEKFEAANPTLLADQLNVDESKAQEITAYLRPNPDFTVTADGTQIAPYHGIWQPLAGTYVGAGPQLSARTRSQT